MVCQATGCDRAANRKSVELCEMHYYRMRRTGSLALRPSTRALPDWTRRVEPKGYIKVKLPLGHPALVVLRPGSKPTDRWVFEHRLVAWLSAGDSSLSCGWCQEPLTWRTAQVDHLDHDKGNNDPENLLVSCNACNMGRGAGANHEAWATAIACRRLLRRHAAEYQAERTDVLRLLRKTGPSPTVADEGRNEAGALRYAAKAMAA